MFFQILYAFGVFMILLVVWLIYQYIIKPYLEISYYVKQGGKPLFFREILPPFRNRIKFFSAYARVMKEYPDARFSVENFGSTVQLILIDPEMIKEMLNKIEIYPKYKRFLQVLTEGVDGFIGFREGEIWKRKRRAISPAFTNQIFREIVPMIVETTQERFSELASLKNFTDIELEQALSDITGNVMGKFFFGKRFGEREPWEEPLVRLFTKMKKEMYIQTMKLDFLFFGNKIRRMNILPRHKSFNKLLAECKERSRKLIDEAAASDLEESNIVKLLLNAQKGELEGDKLDNDQLIGEFAGLFGTGLESVNPLVHKTIKFLRLRPNVWRTVQEEVKAEFGEPKSFNLEKLNRMPYTMAVLKETLRLEASAETLFAREAAQDDDLCGIKVKKGTIVNVCFKTLFRSEKYYVKPNEFLPERWLPNTSLLTEEFKTAPYAYIPFSAGPRNCIGQHFTMIEATIILGLFMKTFYKKE